MQLSPAPCSTTGLTLRGSGGASIRCPREDVDLPKVGEWEKPDEVLLQACVGFGQCSAKPYLKRFPREGRLAGGGFRTPSRVNPPALPAQHRRSDAAQARASGAQSLRVCLQWESSAARYAGITPPCGCNICQRGNSSASLTVPLPPVTLTKPTQALLCQHSCTGGGGGGGGGLCLCMIFTASLVPI